MDKEKTRKLIERELVLEGMRGNAAAKSPLASATMQSLQ